MRRIPLTLLYAHSVEIRLQFIHRDPPSPDELLGAREVFVGFSRTWPRSRRATPRSAGVYVRMTAISVVIPTYEESETIADVVAEVHHELFARAHEIVVVDDSPTDATAQAVRDLDCDDARVLRRERSGLATAVLHGFDRADGDRLVVMDGDGQHPAEVVPELVDALENVDVAIGSRHVGGRNTADWSHVRTAMSFGASAMAWAAVPDSRPVQDPMSGFFAIRRPVVQSVRARVHPDGYKILLELLAHCPVDDVAEIPIEFGQRDGGESKTDLGEVVRFGRHMTRLAVASRRKQRPQPVGPGGEHVDA